MLFLLFIGLVYGDVYMHSPRGANDRNCERNVNRNNGNLLYDTQNNAKGGYACPRAVAASNAQYPAKGLTPRMVFQEGSKLEVEWTAQHGAGNPSQGVSSPLNAADTQNVQAELVVQMGCASTLDPKKIYGTVHANTPQAYLAVPREGIPNSDNDAATNRAGTGDPGQAAGAVNNNVRFGIHETPAWYNECNRVERNKGLFTADQNVNRRSAIGTRQNPNGGRRGLECPEERDYYPYWRASPFIDVAYLVSEAARCGTQALEALPCGGEAGKACVGPVAQGDWVGLAQGVMNEGATAPVSYGLCVNAAGIVPKNNNGLTGAARNAYNRREWPNNPTACAAIGQTWTAKMFTSEFNMQAGTPNPATLEGAVQAVAAKGAECKVIDASRSNHLGNDNGDDTASRYTMTIPAVNPTNAALKSDARGEPCFLRLRYNMSSSDYARNLDAAANGDASPIQQDPLVKVGNGPTEVVQLALNTNQVARTFQDRSYVFYVKPAETPGVEVVNMNVRGKRGNIVQTYPAVEYDIIPSKIVVTPSTVLDVQWVGSDYNPRRGCNDGEGGPYTGDNNVAARLLANPNAQGSNQNSRTDRMSLLATAKTDVNFPEVRTGAMVSGTDELFTAAQAKRFAYADAHQHFKTFAAATGRAELQCLTATEINNINNENRQENHPRNCAEGNALLPYFASEKITFTQNQVGKNYMAYSARNNNFSNRDTKLNIMVRQNVNANTPASIPAEFDFPVFENKVKFEALSDEEITLGMDADVPGFDPVENDDYGEGAKEGCTQDMLVFPDAAPATISVFSLMVCTLITALYASV